MKYDGLIFRIFDLESNQPVLHRASEILISNVIAWPRVREPFETGENILKYMENPFTSLRTCLPFEKENQQVKFTSLENILSELKNKLASNP